MIGNKNFKIDRSKLCSCVSNFLDFVWRIMSNLLFVVLDVNIEISISSTNNCYLGHFIKSSGWTLEFASKSLSSNLNRTFDIDISE